MADPKKTVLIVDDEEDIRDYLSSLLQDHGYDAVCAVDGEDAMEKVKASKPDLITLDISMPEKSGVKFYREMKGSDDWKDIPIIMVTGVTGEFKQFISSRRQVPPPEGYMAKPIDRDKIVEMVGTLTSV
jgi:CheY-like chemotaxis protein